MAGWRDTVLYVYFGLLAVLSIYGAHRYLLVYLFYRHKRDQPRPQEHFAQAPRVTVQLPIFNEATVIERLLESVARLRWPLDRLEIQVLDDSTDETRELAERKVAELRARGVDVHYVR